MCWFCRKQEFRKKTQKKHTVIGSKEGKNSNLMVLQNHPISLLLSDNTVVYDCANCITSTTTMTALPCDSQRQWCSLYVSFFLPLFFLFPYPSVWFFSLNQQPSLSLSHSVDGQSVTSSLPEELLVKPAVDKDRDIAVTPAERRHLSWSVRVLVSGFFCVIFFIFYLCLSLDLSLSLALFLSLSPITLRLS